MLFIVTGGEFGFRGYQVPVDLAELTGGGPETFEAIADAHMASLQKYLQLCSHHRVLELGCGIGRDAIPLTEQLTEGSYVGVDIVEPSIRWCSENISERYPNFKFVHLDVADQLHNPGGSLPTSEFRLPVEDSSIDRVIAWSVLTHMWEADIRHYLREFRRILRPDGLMFLTCFVFTEDVLASARATNLTPFNLRFDYEIYSGCRINDPRYPLGAIAFSEEMWREIVESEGLEFHQPLLRGAWSGYFAEPDDGQDALVLRVPVKLLQ